MALPIKDQPILTKIKPLWLREKLFWKLYAHQKNIRSNLFEDVTLEFAPKVSMKLIPTDISHKQIALLGFYELPVSRRIAKLAQTGGLLIDVGANYGYYSCLWAAARAQNRVVAFEASPRNICALKNNLVNNSFEVQVDVHPLAVGKESGTLPFTLGPEDQSGWGGLLVDQQNADIEVAVVALDNFFSEIEHIDVLKIDVEGADTWVLQGAEQLLRQHKIRHIFFEENRVRMASLGIETGTAQKLLLDQGYKVEELGREQWYAGL